MVSVDVTRREGRSLKMDRAQELSDLSDGSPGQPPRLSQSRWPSWAPVPNNPYSICRRNATLELELSKWPSNRSFCFVVVVFVVVVFTTFKY